MKEYPSLPGQIWILRADISMKRTTVALHRTRSMRIEVRDMSSVIAEIGQMTWREVV